MPTFRDLVSGPVDDEAFTQPGAHRDQVRTIAQKLYVGLHVSPR
jgi:hypothetical protein